MASLICDNGFMTPGEEKAAFHLRDQLPDDWVIVCNRALVVRDMPSREIDEIIVGRGHVFVVDVKSIHGTVSGDDAYWVLPGRKRHRIPSPISNVEQLARVLAGQLREGRPPSRGHFVSGIVILTEATDLRVFDYRCNTQALPLEEAPAELVHIDRQSRSDFVAANRNSILRRLRALPNGPSGPGDDGEGEDERDEEHERTTGLGDWQGLYRDYWTALRTLMLQRGGAVKPTKPQRANWIDFAIGGSDCRLVARANRGKRRIDVHVQLGGPKAKPRFHALRSQQKAIEKQLGQGLEWLEKPGGKESHIRIQREDVDITREADWPAQHEWMYETLERFQEVFAPRLRGL